MEDGFDFAMREKSRGVADGRGHVADDEAEVGFAESADVKGVHPGATAFGFARMPIGVEGTEMVSGFGIVDFVKRDFRMPSVDLRS